METILLIVAVLALPAILWMAVLRKREKIRADNLAYQRDCQDLIVTRQGERLAKQSGDIDRLRRRVNRAEEDADRLGAIVADNIKMVEEFAKTMSDTQPPAMQIEKNALAQWREGRKLRT